MKRSSPDSRRPEQEQKPTHPRHLPAGVMSRRLWIQAAFVAALTQIPGDTTVRRKESLQKTSLQERKEHTEPAPHIPGCTVVYDNETPRPDAIVYCFRWVHPASAKSNPRYFPNYWKHVYLEQWIQHQQGVMKGVHHLASTPHRPTMILTEGTTGPAALRVNGKTLAAFEQIAQGMLTQSSEQITEGVLRQMRQNPNHALDIINSLAAERGIIGSASLRGELKILYGLEPEVTDQDREKGKEMDTAVTEIMSGRASVEQLHQYLELMKKNMNDNLRKRHAHIGQLIQKDKGTAAQPARVAVLLGAGHFMHGSSGHPVRPPFPALETDVGAMPNIRMIVYEEQHLGRLYETDGAVTLFNLTAEEVMQKHKEEAAGGKPFIPRW